MPRDQEKYVFIRYEYNEEPVPEQPHHFIFQEWKSYQKKEAQVFDPPNDNSWKLTLDNPAAVEIIKSKLHKKMAYTAKHIGNIIAGILEQSKQEEE